MATLPDYLDDQLDDQNEDEIRQRMLNNLPSDIDKTEGSYIWDSLSPAAIELAQAAIWAQQVLERGFASTTFGPYLDLRCEEHGLTRRAAVKAVGQVKFIGTAGTVVLAGTCVATSADIATGITVEFITTEEITLDGSGIGYAKIEAVEAGAAGNVVAGTINIIVTPVSGISEVTNLSATTDGLDIENDASLLSRYLQRVRSPSTGGNKADYENWTMEVAGVGGVSVVPVRDGPGTVSIAIINTDKTAANQALIDQVQNYIAPAWINGIEAEIMTLGGYGVSVDTTQEDDTGDSVKMIYNAAGNGTITHTNLQSILQQPGIWQTRVRAKVDNTAGATDLLQIGVWNISGEAWCKTRPGGSVDAVATLKANNLAIYFGDKTVEFYWNGQDQIELRIVRLITDTTTIIWIDRTVYRSASSKDTGEGKAPVGARVTVESATAIPINISATLIIIPGYNADNVKNAITNNITDYIKSLAFISNNDVRYVRIGQAILDTPGVEDYQNLLVNNGTVNVIINDQEVAVVGSVNLT